jgi:TetR/AcrR family transcriptional regulator of autoinduction and epiphytic fitness
MNVIKKTRSELKREAIIEATIEAFQMNGINETSMDNIAELANVSKRTVYNHFESKEKLVTQIFREMWIKSQTLSEVVFHANQPLKPQLIEILKGEMCAMASPTYIEMVRFALGYFIHKPDEMRDYSDEFMNADTTLKRWLKAAVKAQKLMPIDVESANNKLLNLLKGDGFWPQVLRRDPFLTEDEQHNLINDCVDMFLAFYQTSQ